MKHTIAAGLLAGMLAAAPAAEQVNERTMLLNDTETTLCAQDGAFCDVFSRQEIVAMMTAVHDIAFQEARKLCAFGGIPSEH
jgi:DNA transposition AAA+ family ATPase